MICIGIDPGLNRTGYAVVEEAAGAGPGGLRLLEGGVLKSSPRLCLAERCLELRRGLLDVLTDYAPEAAGIEKVFSLAKNPKTAVAMAHARGALLVTLAEMEVPSHHFMPAEIKRHVAGDGQADKEQVQRAVQRLLGHDAPLEPNDVADATAAAICGLSRAGRMAA